MRAISGMRGVDKVLPPGVFRLVCCADALQLLWPLPGAYHHDIFRHLLPFILFFSAIRLSRPGILLSRAEGGGAAPAVLFPLSLRRCAVPFHAS